MSRTVNPSLREGRRKEILSAAELIFSQQGFAQTTISQIAKAAAVSHATIFQYFSTKEELFRTVILENIEKARNFYRGLLLESGDPAERLHTIVDRQIRIAMNSSAYLRLVQQILGQPMHYPELIAELDNFAEEFMRFVAQVLEAGQKEGRVAEGNAHAVARSYFAYWNGVGLCIRNREEETIRELTNNGLRLLGVS